MMGDFTYASQVPASLYGREKRKLDESLWCAKRRHTLNERSSSCMSRKRSVDDAACIGHIQKRVDLHGAQAQRCGPSVMIEDVSSNSSTCVMTEAQEPIPQLIEELRYLLVDDPGLWGRTLTTYLMGERLRCGRDQFALVPYQEPGEFVNSVLQQQHRNVNEDTYDEMQSDATLI